MWVLDRTVVRTTVSLKQSARVFRNRFLGSSKLLQGSLLAYPVAAGAAMVAVEATASPEVSQMAPGQVNWIQKKFLCYLHQNEVMDFVVVCGSADDGTGRLL